MDCTSVSLEDISFGLDWSCRLHERLWVPGCWHAGSQGAVVGRSVCWWVEVKYKLPCIIFWCFCRNDGPVYCHLREKKSVCPWQIYREKKGARKFSSCPYQYPGWVFVWIRMSPSWPCFPRETEGSSRKRPLYTFFVTPEVPMTELGTSNTFSKFIDLLTDLGSPMPPSSALFLAIMVLKRSEPIIPQTQHFPLCQTPLRLSSQPQEQNPCTVQIQRETPGPSAETPARQLAPHSRVQEPACPSPSTSR